MIFKIEISDVMEYAQAKSQLHLLQEYQKEYNALLYIDNVTEISDEQAKEIIIVNTDYDETDPDDTAETTLFELVCGNDFKIVASTEWN